MRKYTVNQQRRAAPQIAAVVLSLTASGSVGAWAQSSTLQSGRNASPAVTANGVAEEKAETDTERVARAQLQAIYDRNDRNFLNGDLIGMYVLAQETSAPVMTAKLPGGKTVTLRRAQMLAEMEEKVRRGDTLEPPDVKALSQVTTVERVQLRKGGLEAVALVRQRGVDLRTDPRTGKSRRITNLGVARDTWARTRGGWQLVAVEVLRDDYYEGGKLVRSDGKPVPQGVTARKKPPPGRQRGRKL